MSGITFLKQNPSRLGWDSPIRKMACGLSFLLWLALLQTSLAVNVPGPNGTVVTQILSATSSNPEVKVVEDRDLGKILVYPPQPKEFTVEIIARIMYPDDQYLEKISTVMVGGAGVTIESDEIRNSLILATLKVAPGASGGRFSITYENEDNPNHKGCNVRLLPVEVVELSPKLVDESDVEIVGSDKPEVAPKPTEMVERNPLADPQINDASQVRIAWRDMKVKIGKPLAGKIITWSMTPQFTPLQADGTLEAAPRFRGVWGRAVNTAYRHRFSASENYEENDYESATSEVEAVTGANVTITATTTVDDDGYTSIRVNLPPIGFNKALIKIAIEDVEEEIDLIELEVPAVIVIDPGHGGILPPTDQERIAAGYTRSPTTGAWRLGGSSVNNATAAPSMTLEKDMAWDISSKLKDELIERRVQDDINMKILLTRAGDNNLTLAARANKGRDNGADVLLSIHFNGFNGVVRGTETHIDHTGNLNRPLDESTSQRINTSIFDALMNHDPNAVNRGPKDERGLDVLSDPDLGNTANYGFLSAVLAEIEFIDVAAVDQLLNTNENHQDVRTSIADEIAGALIEDIKTNH